LRVADREVSVGQRQWMRVCVVLRCVPPEPRHVALCCGLQH
jgi:hypothetical protein